MGDSDDIMSHIIFIREAVVRTESKLDNHVSATNTRINKLDGDVYGNGEGKTGLKILMDRLSQKDKNVSKWTLIFFTSLTGLVVERVYHYFF